MRILLLFLFALTLSCNSFTMDRGEMVRLHVLNRSKSAISYVDNHRYPDSIFPGASKEFELHVNDYESIKLFIRYGEHYFLCVTQTSTCPHPIAYIYVKDIVRRYKWVEERRNITEQLLRGIYKSANIIIDEQGIPYFEKPK